MTMPTRLADGVQAPPHRPAALAAARRRRLLPLVRAGVKFRDGVRLDSVKPVTPSTDNQPECVNEMRQLASAISGASDLQGLPLDHDRSIHNI